MKAFARSLAHAKINLVLAVLGRRPDGYHELDTVMAGLALADELELVPLAASEAPEGLSELLVDGPLASADIPCDRRNLAYAAIEDAFQRASRLGCETPPHWRLRLTKRIPSQAGLGGGSSDGATALRLVEDLCTVDLGEEWRMDWLARAGSDTVFFDAAARTLHARCQGRGERVQELGRLPRDWRLVVVTPDLVAPTGAVFSALRADPRQGPFQEPAAFAELSLPEAQAGLGNDLEAAALAAVPGLLEWAEWLAQSVSPRFMMSGSGTSFFALCANDLEADELMAKLEQAPFPKRLLWKGSFAKVLE